MAAIRELPVACESRAISASIWSSSSAVHPEALALSSMPSGVKKRVRSRVGSGLVGAHSSTERTVLRWKFGPTRSVIGSLLKGGSDRGIVRGRHMDRFEEAGLLFGRYEHEVIVDLRRGHHAVVLAI